MRIVPQSTSDTDIAMRRIYRLVDIGKSETWRTLEKTTRICTKRYSAIPNKISEVVVANGNRVYVPAYTKVPKDRRRGGSQTMKIPGIEI